MATPIEEAKAFIIAPVIITEAQQDDVYGIQTKSELDSFLANKRGQSFKQVGEPRQTQAGVFFYFEHPNHPYDASKAINDLVNLESYQHGISLGVTPDRKITIACSDRLQLLLQTNANGGQDYCAVLSISSAEGDSVAILSDRSFGGRNAVADNVIMRAFGHERAHASKSQHNCDEVNKLLSAAKPAP